MRVLGAVSGVLVIGALTACAHEPRGMMMNHFVPDAKLAAVRVCETTAAQLVQSLGQPNGQGRDGDMGTLNWSSAAMVSDSEQTAIGTQMIYAWIDADGRVAGFVVNPTSLPAKPSPCREQHPDATPEATPPPAAKPTDA
jgi:hypothetical protein